MPTVLVTGANRGLGLEFARQYAAAGWTVHATCRQPEAADALRALAEASPDKVRVHPLNVTDHARVDALAEELAGEAIDVLLNNAGAFGNRAGFGSSDYSVWERTVWTNTFGPMKLAEAFVEHVARSERKVIANVTSKMGSIADNTSGSYYIYRSTKAALNMITKSMAIDLAPRGIRTVVLHPGWVKTDMGGPSAPLDPPESVAGMRRVIDGLSAETSGSFFDYSGAEVPW
ncbi:MAG: SDR family oxidoreductase [Planctomycetota bacterium]|nr:MAG: SDR family oxidoreductase [Planctomycetota bacterium]